MLMGCLVCFNLQCKDVDLSEPIYKTRWMPPAQPVGAASGM